MLPQQALYWYANELLRRLPRTADGRTSVPPPHVGTDWYIKLSEGEMRVACHLVTTADFCRETSEGLAAAIAKDIRPDLLDQVAVGPRGCWILRFGLGVEGSRGQDCWIVEMCSGG